jgi:hypothetical protein
MLAIFLPYILAYYVSVTKLNKAKIIQLIIKTLPAVIAFLFSICHFGTNEQVADIYDSLKQNGYMGQVGGAISSLPTKGHVAIEKVAQGVLEENYLSYFLLLPLLVFAYIPLYKYLGPIRNAWLVYCLILSSIIGSIGLFVTALDWGRFLYIHMVSIFLFSFQYKHKSECIHSKQKIPTILVLFFFIYISTWHLPHFGNPLVAIPTSISKSNFLKPATPFYNVYSYYFPNNNLEE